MRVDAYGCVCVRGCVQVLPRVMEQVISCKDDIAQQYLFQVCVVCVCVCVTCVRITYAHVCTCLARCCFTAQRMSEMVTRASVCVCIYVRVYVKRHKDKSPSLAGMYICRYACLCVCVCTLYRPSSKCSQTTFT